MRIAYLCADRGIPVLGDKGASVHLRSIASALARRDHAVLLLAANLSGENRPPLRVAVDRLVESDLETRLRVFDPDVVMERYALATDAGFQAARRLHRSFILEMNAPLADEAARYRALPDVGGWRRREARRLASADHIIAVSAGVRAHAIRLGARSDRVTVVHNGVDASLFEAGQGEPVRRRYSLGGNFVVGFAGSLKPWHGVAGLVQAFARLPEESRLLLVGGGPQRKEIEHQVEHLGLSSRVILTGAVPHDQVPDHLAAMDVGVAPYEPQPDFYFSPLKVAEYMAAGLPVVASRQGDIESIVDGGGLLVKPGDVGALAGALRRLLEDEAFRHALGQRAHDRVMPMTWDRVAGYVEEILARCEAAA